MMTNAENSARLNGKQIAMAMKMLFVLTPLALALAQPIWTAADEERPGSRFCYLDERGPYYPHAGFPRLETPMWIGEEGVDAAVLLTIDDMGRPVGDRYNTTPAEFERFLAPLVARLQAIDGRAPITIFTCQARPAEPILQRFLKQGLSLEGHSYTHPVPLLRTVGEHEPGAQSLQPARYDFDACMRNLFEIPNNRPVAYRMPGCDARNTTSPRFYTEVFPAITAAGQFLACDSSVMTYFPSDDPTVPRELLFDASGRERFAKYVRDIPQTRHFVNTVTGYPYPYVIDRRIWEFPAVIPGDSHGVHKHQANSPKTVEDWKRAIDVTVHKRGLCTILFHTIGYIEAEQMVDVIDYTHRTYGRRVKFVNCREVHDRLTRNVLGGHALRSKTGQDNGVRLLDVNADGIMDAVIANSKRQESRVWQPDLRKWQSTKFPIALVTNEDTAQSQQAGGMFFTATNSGYAGLAVSNEKRRGVWHFDGVKWMEQRDALPREVDGETLYTTKNGVDRGVRFRDLNADGLSDLIVNNERQNAVLLATPRTEQVKTAQPVPIWQRATFSLPQKGCLVDDAGSDQGLRFVDLDADGDDDLVYSNDRRYWVRLLEDDGTGWSSEAISGVAGDRGSIPAIVRGQSINGVWFHSRAMILENEFTAKNKDGIVRIPFDRLTRKSSSISED